MKELIKILIAAGAGIVWGIILVFLWAGSTNQRIKQKEYYMIADSLGHVITLESLDEKTMVTGYHVQYLTKQQYDYGYKYMNHKSAKP